MDFQKSHMENVLEDRKGEFISTCELVKQNGEVDIKCI